jgi:hypothetical protein
VLELKLLRGRGGDDVRSISPNAVSSVMRRALSISSSDDDLIKLEGTPAGYKVVI